MKQNKPVHELLNIKITKDYLFLVVGAYCFGTGETIEAALKNANKTGDVSRAYCVLVPTKETGAKWSINGFGGVSVNNGEKYDVLNNPCFKQLWNKDLHIKGTKRGTVSKFGFGLFN